MLVSIIIPTYNRASMLLEAVDSVLAQEWPALEVIIVDDGSTDDTRSQVTSLQSHKSQGHKVTSLQGHKSGDVVKYIRIPHSGVSAARNAGIREAKGELIAFLDSDDYWLPGKLALQVGFFKKNPDIHICQTEEIWIRSGRRVNPKKIHKKHSGWIFEKCIPRCIVSPSAVMIRWHVFDGIGLFDEEMPVCEDYDLWLRAALKYQIVTLSEPGIVKRGGHEDQLSSQWGLDIWRIRALKKVLKNGIDDPWLEKLVQEDIVRRTAIVENGARKRFGT